MASRQDNVFDIYLIHDSSRHFVVLLAHEMQNRNAANLPQQASASNVQKNLIEGRLKAPPTVPDVILENLIRDVGRFQRPEGTRHAGDSHERAGQVGQMSKRVVPQKKRGPAQMSSFKAPNDIFATFLKRCVEQNEM